MQWRCSIFLFLCTLAQLSFSAMAPQPLHAQRDSLVGCYDLSLGPWTPSLDLGGDTLFIAPPLRIYLDSLATGPLLRPGELSVRPAPGSPPSVHRFASWRRVAGDTIHIMWSTGFSGIVMQLEAGDQVLRGHAETIWDFERQPQRAQVEARRVSCSAPTPREWANYRRFPREVLLDTGHRLALGEPLPDLGPLLERDHRGAVVRSRPVGVFAGAIAVRIGSDSAGLVRRLDVVYPPGEEFDAVVERLSAAFGPPTGEWSISEDSLRAIWSGRDSGISLSKTRLVVGGTEVSIMLRDQRY